MSSAKGNLWARSLPVAVCLAVPVGIFWGWRLASAATPTFDYVRALASPAGLTALCVVALLKSARRARWLVPLLLTFVLLDVVNHPHVPALTVLGLVAAVMAAFASLVGRKRLAIAGILICGPSMSASLVMGLSPH